MPYRFRPSGRRLRSLRSRDFDMRDWIEPRRRKPRDKDDGGVPVEPNRPDTLSGGAAAALEFDD